MTAAIDDVAEFFETIIEELVPTTDPGKRFHLIGENSGRLADQPKNSNFHRMFDVRFGWDPETTDSFMPLVRKVTVLIMIGYLGSLRTRQVEKIMRQDEELIARHLHMNAINPVANRPFQWEIRPPFQHEELDEAGSASILVIQYEANYTCESV